MTTLFVPGRGSVNLAVARIDRAVREYDERLLFARHPQTGQWSVFIKIERDLPEEFGTVVEGQRVYPVLGFPHDRDPETLDIEEIKVRLYKADSVRHGKQILADMHAHNERVKEPQRRVASEAAGIAAEVLESYLNDRGVPTKYRRLTTPKGVHGRTSVRGH